MIDGLGTREIWCAKAVVVTVTVALYALISRVAAAASHHIWFMRKKQKQFHGHAICNYAIWHVAKRFTTYEKGAACWCWRYSCASTFPLEDHLLSLWSELIYILSPIKNSAKYLGDTYRRHMVRLKLRWLLAATRDYFLIDISECHHLLKGMIWERRYTIWGHVSHWLMICFATIF